MSFPGPAPAMPTTYTMPRPAPAQPRPRQPAAPTALQLAMPTILVTLVLTLALPYAVISAGVAAPLRIIFPLYALGVGAYLTRQHRTLYPGFILALFAFTPFLRRVIDYQSGYALFNLILLAPYTALIPALPSLGRRLLGQAGRLQWPFVLLTICVVYAVFLALYAGKLAPVGNEPMRWLLPLALCTFVMDRPQDFEAMRKAVMTSLLLILPVLTIYGIEQYLNPPLWDVLWMQNVDIGAFGQPAPYEIRVFSMMNSPLSVGIFGVSAMILLAGEGVLGLLVAIAAVPLIAVTLLREAWVIAAVALVIMLLLATTGRRLTLLLGMAVAAVLFTGAVTSHMLPSSIVNPLIDRFSSLSDVQSGTDHSADDRRVTYDSMFTRLGDSPWGEGFGANGSQISRADKRDLVPLDSCVLEGVVTFGVIAGAAYFLAVVALFLSAMRASRATRGRMAAHVALLAGLLITTPIGQNLIGEASIIGWISIGLLIGSAELERQRIAAARPAQRF